ncbi:Hypothetical_protein [Hexamita inflata]|uniref:Hypothetical_protein n=1 Tax=Hexamita inflata TaxID=28002 RepID=A0AA86NT80_9EUKA|nr:Hypothetical protein HINF_LOCUS12666 [Hexamita inflata]
MIIRLKRKGQRNNKKLQDKKRLKKENKLTIPMSTKHYVKTSNKKQSMALPIFSQYAKDGQIMNSSNVEDVHHKFQQIIKLWDLVKVSVHDEISVSRECKQRQRIVSMTVHEGQHGKTYNRYSKPLSSDTKIIKDLLLDYDKKGRKIIKPTVVYTVKGRERAKHDGKIK